MPTYIHISSTDRIHAIRPIFYQMSLLLGVKFAHKGELWLLGGMVTPFVHPSRGEYTLLYTGAKRGSSPHGANKIEAVF
jgi:hypothetical protein